MIEVKIIHLFQNLNNHTLLHSFATHYLEFTKNTQLLLKYVDIFSEPKDMKTVKIPISLYTSNPIDSSSNSNTDTTHIVDRIKWLLVTINSIYHNSNVGYVTNEYGSKLFNKQTESSI